MPRISITSDSNTFFLIIIFVIFRTFNRKRREYLRLCYLATFLIMIFPLKFQIEHGFISILLLYKNVPQLIFFILETITLCHYIQHITMHKNLVCLANTNRRLYQYRRL